MKKVYLFFVCAVALFNYGYTQWNDDGNFKCWNEDLLYKADNLKSKVKSITCFGYNLEKLSGGVEQKKLFGKATYCYDSLGNRTKELYYDPNGDLSVYSILMYNEDGYIIEKRSFSGYASDTSGLMHITSKKYDTKNNVVEDKFYSYMSGSKTYTYNFIYKYDLKGNIIEKTESSYVDGKSSWNRNYNYNYRYNSKGSLVETVTFLNGFLEKKDFFKYDLKNRPFEWIQSNAYSNTHRFIHKYDTRDNIAEEIEYNNGVIKRRIFFKYDNKNNIIKTIIIYYGIKYPLQNVEYEYQFY